MSVVHELAKLIGDSSAEKTLLESEERINRYLLDVFSGYKKSAEDVLNVVEKVSSYEGLVCVDNIQFYTYCGHHFAPFWGSASVTYHPNHKITGLGKIVRLVRDVHSRRLQIQEFMTRDIAMDISRVLDAKGVRVVTKAKHLCMCSRGPSDDVSETTVTYEVGSLLRSNICDS